MVSCCGPVVWPGCSVPEPRITVCIYSTGIGNSTPVAGFLAYRKNKQRFFVAVCLPGSSQLLTKGIVNFPADFRYL